MIICFVDIGGIVNYHCLDFLFIIFCCWKVLFVNTGAYFFRLSQNSVIFVYIKKKFWFYSKS